MTDFRIVSDFSPVEVQRNVNELLALGFELRGPLMLSTEFCHAAGFLATKYTQVLVSDKGDR